MAVGIYTAPERVERDGFLVCFAGERMTTAEAVRRGLAAPGQDAPAAPPSDGGSGHRCSRPSANDMKRISKLIREKKASELEAMADAMGLEYAKGSTKAVLAEAIAMAEREAAEGA